MSLQRLAAVGSGFLLNSELLSLALDVYAEVQRQGVLRIAVRPRFSVKL